MTLQQLREALSSSIVAGISSDRRYIATGLIYPDGDSINIYLQSSPARGSRITDRGTTREKLASSGVRLSSGHAGAINYIQNRFDVTLSDGVVSKLVTCDLGRSAIEFCEAISYLSGLAYHKESKKRSDFDQEVEEFMRSEVGPKRKYQTQWTAKGVDPNGVFPVDFRINDRGRPRNIFSVHTPAKSDLVAAVTGFLGMKGLRSPSMAIVDQNSEIGPKKAERLSLVSDDWCVGVDANRQRIIDFALA